MFGFSFAELILVFLVTLLFIKPQDLPEIANAFGKIFYRTKKLFNEMKRSLKELGDELGVDDLKHEMDCGIAEEKAKIEEEMTVIVDIYGNEHRVANVKEIRPDLLPEEIEEEVARHNKANSQPEISDQK